MGCVRPCGGRVPDEGKMIDLSKKSEATIHFAAIKLAHECRRVVQACLREDEWRLADEEFYKLIRPVLEVIKCDVQKSSSADS
jgi:hypothetical protein